MTAAPGAVKRYSLLERDSNGDFDAHMEASPEGAWVSYADHLSTISTLEQQLAAEREARVKAEGNAARYEWLRDPDNSDALDHFLSCAFRPDELDAAIDLAIQKGRHE